MNKKYKHYSFDLWGTLIKSNPKFKQVRAEYFAQNFNRNGLKIEEVAKVFENISLMCDAVDDVINIPIDAFQMYTIALQQLNYDISLLTQRDILAIYNVVETNFLRHHPVLFDENTENVLKQLKSSGATLSILSNTAYAKGHSIKKVLDKLGISQYFTFMLFSDEIRISKPNHVAFSALKDAVMHYRTFTPIETSEIVHIGDNDRADGASKSAGIDSIIINSNSKRIKDLL